MRSAILLVLALPVACASSGEPPATRISQETMGITDAGGRTMEVTLNNVTTRDLATFPAPASAVWSTLPAVYDSLGIPVAELNTSTRTIGNTGLRVRRQLGGTRVSRYFTCGATQGAPNADAYEVQISAVTQVQPAGADSSRVSMLIEAQAKPMSVSGGWVRCTSTGALQTRIIELIGRHLGR